MGTEGGWPETTEGRGELLRLFAAGLRMIGTQVCVHITWASAAVAICYIVCVLRK